MCVEPNIGGAQQLSFVPDGSPAELKYLFEQRGSTLASGKRFADANGFFTYRFQLEEVFDAALDLTLSGQYKVELSTDNAGWQLLFAGDPNMKEVGPQVAKSVASLKELAGDLSTFYLRISDLEPADGWGGAVHKLSLSYVTLQPTGIVAGIVCDQSGNPLDGVSVILGNKYLRRTDAAGAFIFSAFPAGSYSLTLQKAGWQTYVLPESFQLEAGRAKNFALSLELAQDGQPPAAPEEISVDTALAGVAIVSWHPAAVGAPAAFYNVYRAASQEPPSLAAYSLTDTRWIDYDVEQGREYAYIVTALDSAGRESEGRSSAAVRISSIAVPGLIEPRESIAEAGDVTFKWGEVADAAAYELMIADNAQFAEPQVIQAQTASQTVSLSGGVWYWKVRAVNSVGKKGPCSLPAKFAIAGGSADALSIAQLLTSPNPFSFNQNKMRITFQITQEAKVKLRIYSLSGRLVQDYPAEQLQAGVNTFEWDGRTYAGEKVPTGAYILFIQADSTALEKGSKVELKKLLTVVH